MQYTRGLFYIRAVWRRRGGDWFPSLSCECPADRKDAGTVLQKVFFKGCCYITFHLPHPIYVFFPLLLPERLIASPQIRSMNMQSYDGIAVRLLCFKSCVHTLRKLPQLIFEKLDSILVQDETVSWNKEGHIFIIAKGVNVDREYSLDFQKYSQ